ncbi:bifunctional metallophosphatase/5'-nucleotidase [Streptosporangiaceae bacterium NEAU-GS5]|nr:bifunctional metallophosphatase/5'-nucleotidase [Streptosporangiaceae bacterium NEAU-GS5]
MTPASLKRLAMAGLVVAAGVAVAAGPASADKEMGGHKPPPPPIPVRLLSINDFHGNLEMPTGSGGRLADENGVIIQGVGGAAALAAAIKQSTVRGQTDIVGAGDLIGASPLISAAYHDEPTVSILGKMGLDVSSVGNHEYDEGMAELLRIQNGGCHPVDGCSPAGKWKGAQYQYLAANVVDQRNRNPLPPIAVRKVNGVKVGYIGLVTKSTPTIVTAEGIQGLTFQDEVEAGNRASKLLSKMGVKVQVALIHEGDSVAAFASPDSCPLTTTIGKTIATNLDPAIDVVIMGHSHQAYICTTTDPAGQTRYFTQGSSFGRALTQIDFQVDRKTDDVIRSSVTADNKVVATSAAFVTNAAGTVNNGPYAGTKFADDPTVGGLVATAKNQVAAVANKPIGTITADITNSGGTSGESPLGNLIADSQLEATKTTANAVIALMNIGGVRQSLTFAGSTAGEGDGVVTYGEAFAVQPFNNLVQVVTLTGAQLKLILEQQYVGGPNNQPFDKVLQPSSNLTYTVHKSAAWGSKISDIAIGGTPVTDTQSIRVTANNFLVGGGDGFAGFTAGTDKFSGPLDIDAFAAYLTAHSPIAPPAADEITFIP